MVFGNVDGFRTESPVDGPVQNLCSHVPSHSTGQGHLPKLVTEMVNTPGLLSPMSEARALARGPGITSELQPPAMRAALSKVLSPSEPPFFMG